MSEPLVTETERQEQQAEKAEQIVKFVQPGERISAIAHLSFSAVFLLTVVILVSVSRQYEVSKNLDFVKIYDYKKSAPKRSDAVDAMRAYVIGDDGKWINEAADTEGCRDMVNYWWPTASTTANSGNCVFKINLKMGPMEEQLQVKDITPISVSGCTAGTYPIALTLANGNTGTISGTMPSVYIDTYKNLTFVNAGNILGYNFKTLSKNYVTCIAKRTKLANTMHKVTECENGFSSPLCTCVRAFTGRIQMWQSRLGAISDNKLPLGEVVTRGVERCMQLRRSHDVREPIEQVYARSSALLVFAVALVANALLNVLNAYDLLESTVWYSVYFVLYFVAVIFTSLLDNKGSGLSQFQTVLAMTLPAFIVHGGYCVMLHASSITKAASYDLPFLHPVTFDICLCALTLFTLVERGVVQTEYLVAETLKCHVVAAVYIAVVWYHCYGRGRDALETEFVQQAYLILFIVGLVSSLSSAVTPYATKECFELHWLLPGALTYLAFVNPGWSVHLRMAAKLKVPMTSAVYNFNSVAGFLVLLVGGMLLANFLSEYFQIYGAKNFAWPVYGDPMSFAATRSLVMPVA